MNLDTITVNIRPRSPWEAIDIGCVLARKWYWKLWRLWLLTTFPYLILITGLGFLLPGSAAKWTLVLFWLLKPFYEIPILNWISKALFADNWTIRETIRDTRKNISCKRMLGILFNRFSPFRSFSLPVLMLEGITGKTCRSRLALLKDGYETAAYLTIAGICIEVILTFSLMSTLYWFIPEELRWVDLGDFIFQPDNWLILLSYIVSCSMFAPLYICSGFMMYISRRVELEAWDIEIGFKRIQQRLQNRKNRVIQTGSVVILLLVVTSLTSLAGRASATSPDPTTAQTTIASVLDQNEFGRTVTEYRWVPIERDTPDKNSALSEWWVQLFEALEKILKNFSSLIAKSAEFLLWGCAGAAVAFLLLKYSRLHAWLGYRFASAGQSYKPPEIMFGMDLRPENLPENIGDACRRLLAKGKQREAMSLLYRGTLSRLVNHYQLEILSSYTEKECCQEVTKSRPTPEATFFDDLTCQWVFTAYGHQEADLEKCRVLISQWQSLYGAQS